jgi:hypothetical protein
VSSRSPLKPVRPSRESRAEYEGLDLPSGHSVVTETPIHAKARGTGGPTSPAVKTSSPCLPPRGADRAVGGIRAGIENSGRRASATNDSTPIPTIRPNPNNSLQPPRFAGVRGRCRPWGCSGAIQEPAIGSATSCHPAVLGLDPAMASWGSRRAHTSASQRRRSAAGPRLRCPRVAAICARPPTQRRPAFISRQLVRGRLTDALCAAGGALARSSRRSRPSAALVANRRCAATPGARPASVLAGASGPRRRGCLCPEGAVSRPTRWWLLWWPSGTAPTSAASFCDSSRAGVCGA